MGKPLDSPFFLVRSLLPRQQGAASLAQIGLDAR